MAAVRKTLRYAADLVIKPRARLVGDSPRTAASISSFFMASVNVIVNGDVAYRLPADGEVRIVCASLTEKYDTNTSKEQRKNDRYRTNVQNHKRQRYTRHHTTIRKKKTGSVGAGIASPGPFVV